MICPAEEAASLLQPMSTFLSLSSTLLFPDCPQILGCHGSANPLSLSVSLRFPQECSHPVGLPRE